MIITKYEITAPIPRALRFAWVSDIHDAEINPILDAIAASDAEAVLVSGDFITDATRYESGLAFLTEAAKMRPVFCSLGNHEMKFGKPLLPLIEKTGVILLDDSYTTFRGIHIGGLTSGFGWDGVQGNLKETPIPNLPWLATFSELHGYKLLLSHHPEYYVPYIKALPIDLTLSGHAHGGQWRIFGQGIFAPGQGFFPKYTSGFHDGRFLISRGLGDSHHFPPRIFNRPELIFITLKTNKLT